MPIITIKAEMLAGTEISKAFEQAIRVARKLDVNIEFNFNGVTCFATPNGDCHRGAGEYNEAIKKHELKFAHSG